MEVNEQLVRAVTQAVVAQLMASGAQPQDVSSTPAPEGAGSFAGKTRMRPKHSYEDAVRAQKGTDPKEIVIGVGAAFQTEITKTMSGIPLEEVLRNIKAGIEEEGMTSQSCQSAGYFRCRIYGTGSCEAFRIRNRNRHPVQRNNRDPSERSVSAFQSGAFSTGATDGPGYIP